MFVPGCVDNDYCVYKLNTHTCTIYIYSSLASSLLLSHTLHSSTDLLIPSHRQSTLTLSLIHSLTHSLSHTHTLTHALTSFVHSFTHPFCSCSLSHSLLCFFSHSCLHCSLILLSLAFCPFFLSFCLTWSSGSGVCQPDVLNKACEVSGQVLHLFSAQLFGPRTARLPCCFGPLWFAPLCLSLAADCWCFRSECGSHCRGRS